MVRLLRTGLFTAHLAEIDTVTVAVSEHCIDRVFRPLPCSASNGIAMDTSTETFG